MVERTGVMGADNNAIKLVLGAITTAVADGKVDLAK